MTIAPKDVTDIIAYVIAIASIVVRYCPAKDQKIIAAIIGILSKIALNTPTSPPPKK